MYFVLNKTWSNYGVMNLYSGILVAPVFLLFLTVGILLAIVVDFVIAAKNLI